MMSPVRRLPVAFAGLLSLMVAAVAGVGGTGAAASSSAAAASAAVRTVLGPGVLDGPSGIALDTAGDLFVADTGHCQVLVVPSRAGVLDGLQVRPGHATALVGGACTGHGSIGHPSGVAVDGHGDLYIAEATAQRVQEVRAGSHAAVTVAGTGVAGFNGDGLAATGSQLNEPTGVAVDTAGDVFIADTANCRVRVLPATTTTLFGLSVTAGHLATVAGTGVCGSAGQGGPTASAQLSNPVAVTLDTAGDLLVADSGDQSVLLEPVHGGSFWGSPVGTGDIGVIVGGTGGYGPYVIDGLPANGPAAELNDPRGLAIGPRGALYVSDGFMHVIRVVPAVSETILGRAMTAGDLYTAAGALPVTDAAGTNDGTRWIGTQMGTPAGLAVSRSGGVYYADAGASTVRVLDSGGGAS